MTPIDAAMPGRRRPDLDWLRVGAFFLLIFYHVGMAFVTWDWHVKTAHPSDTIEPLMRLLNPWRLSLLFFVSGAATHYMAARITPGRLAALRWKRLGIPLLFGVLVIVPPQSYVQVREHGYHLSYWAFYGRYLTAYHGFCDAHGCLFLPTWNHLWFVAYLLVYTSLLLTVLACGVRMPAGVSRMFARAMSGVFCLILPASWLAMLRMVLAPRFHVTDDLIHDWYAHALYCSVFLLGWWMAWEPGFWASVTRWRFPALGVALSAYALFIWCDRIVWPGDTVAPPWAYVALDGLYGVEQWCWIAAILGFGHRHLRHGGPVLDYLTQGIFPFYIVHQTIIVTVEFWLKGWHLAAPEEGAILIAVTAAGCLASYEVVRRIAILRPLFGLKAGAGKPGGVAAAHGRRPITA
jgi:hypothetical protein